MNGAFNAEVRMLLCGQCGAALPFTHVGGGQIQCLYCNTVTVVTPRDDRSMSRGPVDEGQRVANLWTQLQSEMRVHPECYAILDDKTGLLLEKNVATAMKMWEDARRKQAVDPALTADDLLWLTISLTMFFTDDRVRCRALWESALESSHDPHHRQYIRCALSRAATKDGDLKAAQAWLDPCDPQPQHLLSDTAYRSAYAYLASARGEIDDVLRALGPSTDSFPLFVSLRVLCNLLRANAFEKRGDVQTATAQLTALIAMAPALATVLPVVAHGNAFLNLCPQSLHAALRR
jgi:hypothetical protein